MNTSLVCIYIGGGLHIAWALFHLAAPRIMGWKDVAENWDSGNRSFYQMLNLCMLFFMVACAYFSLVYAPELLQESVGRKLLAMFAAFWLLRFGLQNRLFKVFTPMSVLMNFGYLITAVVYIIPVIKGH